jgi:hypothetical protein
MPDHTNDIAELLDNLDGGYWPEKHAALIALVAERDALKQRVAELESHNSVSVRLLLAERDALREQLRLANIDQFNTEAEANDRDRELRERLVCAALTALCADPRYEVADADRVVAIADAALAAMRKGERDGK